MKKAWKKHVSEIINLDTAAIPFPFTTVQVGHEEMPRHHLLTPVAC